MTTAAIGTFNLGFLTVLQDSNGYLGGFLVTNQWGRPLEFRLSSAVQPNRVHKILYANTLEPYICADLIGKTLIDKTPTPAQIIVTDTPACLELRLRLEAPVVWVARARRSETALARGDAPPRDADPPAHALAVREGLYCHGQFAGDEPLINDLLDRLIGNMDLAEPFARIREALTEARKLGVRG